MSERCEVCDRERCPALCFPADVHWADAKDASRADCEAHAVDWRSRALAAEAALVEWVAAFDRYRNAGSSGDMNEADWKLREFARALEVSRG